MHRILSEQRIAITRPVGQAKQLKVLLEDSGAKTIDFPLISIAPLADLSEAEAKFLTIDYVDWLVFISSNAVNYAMPRLLALWKNKLPSNLRFAAIGPVTAQSLQQFGVKKVLIPDGRFDSESLLKMPEVQAVDGQKVMIVRGVGGRELLAKQLRARGASVTFAECYQRINPQRNCDLIFSQEKQVSLCDAIVVTSSEAMRFLLGIAQIKPENADNHWLKQIQICVNLPRVAQGAEALGLSTHIAGEPGDTAMQNCLIKALRNDNN